jgi:hypothetical protein
VGGQEGRRVGPVEGGEEKAGALTSLPMLPMESAQPWRGPAYYSRPPMRVS